MQTNAHILQEYFAEHYTIIQIHGGIRSNETSQNANDIGIGVVVKPSVLKICIAVHSCTHVAKYSCIVVVKPSF